jgi:hypothetical protein
MTIHVELAVDNATHFMLKDTTNRSVFLTKVKGGVRADVAPASNDPAKVVWDLPDTDFDHFFVGINYRFAGYLGTALFAQQSFTFDGKLCVESPIDARPRAFDAHAHPLLVSTATTAGGVSRLDLKLRTSVVDLSEPLIEIQAHDTHPFTYSNMTSADNAAACDVRCLCYLGQNDAAIPLVVVIPPAAKSATGPVGALTFYGPGISIPRLKGKDEDGLRAEFKTFFSHAGRYIEMPGKDSSGSKVDCFGITLEDTGGNFPNLMTTGMLARSNKPFIFVLYWGGWGTLTPGQLERAIAFLWGSNRIAQPQSSGVKLGRFGIAGFSFGGQGAMDAVISVGSRASEVWLFDPKFAQTAGDIGPEADNRQQAVVNWFRSQAQDKTKMLRCVSGVFEITRLVAIRSLVGSASNFATNFTLAPKALAAKGTTSYYGKPDDSKIDPDYSRAAGIFGASGKRPDIIGWIAHQWVVVGGEDYATKNRMDPTFHTYMGDFMAASGF